MTADPTHINEGRWCWPFRHVWTGWSVVARGNMVIAGSDIPTGKYVTQERECYRCGKIQLREERS